MTTIPSLQFGPVTNPNHQKALLLAEKMKYETMIAHVEEQLSALGESETTTKTTAKKTSSVSSNKSIAPKGGKPTKNAKPQPEEDESAEEESEEEDVEEESDDEVETETEGEDEEESETEEDDADDTDAADDVAPTKSARGGKPAAGDISDDDIKKDLTAYAKAKNSAQAAQKLLARFKVTKSNQLNQKQRREIRALIKTKRKH